MMPLVQYPRASGKERHFEPIAGMPALGTTGVALCRKKWATDESAAAVARAQRLLSRLGR